ncbi:MAG: HD domain-containing phosphohydrolase [Actinomycetota bacterium]
MQESKPTAQSPHGRWSSRPFLSAFLRLFIFLAPSVASLATGLTLARSLEPPEATLATWGWWAGILIASYVTLFVAQRLVRRLTPLAMLLDLTLTFPDRAPSRYKVARRSGNIAELRKRLSETAAEAGGLDPTAETILALVTALSTHDLHTRGHSERVRVFTDMLGEELHLSPTDRDRLRWAALLHDVGKLEVPAEILNKAGPLDDDEWRVVRRHPEMGVSLIGPLASWLGPYVKTIEQHHERYDGGGYPNELKGEEISIGGRIVAVADAFETMTAARSYKKPLSAATARKELSACAGKQFDPGVVRAMMSISLGKLWWRVGFIAWLAQLPLLGSASRLLERTGQTATTAAGAAAAAAVIAFAGLTVPAHLAQPSLTAEPAPPPLQMTATPPRIDMDSRERRAPTSIPEGSAAASAPVGETPPAGPPGSEAPEGAEVAENTNGDEGGDAETGSAGGSSGGDKGLIEIVIETVEGVVEDLPPGAGQGIDTATGN